MRQNALTVIVPIKPGDVEDLRQFLLAIGENINKNPNVDFYQSPSTHFARFGIVEQERDRDLGPRLYFSSNYDGSFESYIKELVENFGTQMEPIWSRCEGYPSGAAQEEKLFTEFVRRHSYPHTAFKFLTFYVATPGATVKNIRNSATIRAMIDQMLDRKETTPWLRNLAQQLPPAPLETKSQPVSTAVDGESALARVVEWLAGVRSGKSANRNMQVEDELAGIEDRVVQNQMTVIVPIKPWFWPRFFVRLVLWAVSLKARGAYGSLAGLSTIHFARWVIIDNGRNLLFESNFDGSWEKYIDDFVDFASLGMNAIWANCVGFPRGGCRDIEWFKEYIRDNQIPAQVFYSAYPQTTVRNKLTDLQIAGSVGQFVRQKDVEQFLSGAYRSQSFAALPPLFREDKPASPQGAGKLVFLGAVVLVGLWYLRSDSDRRTSISD
jgi:hypothetical protein